MIADRPSYLAPLIAELITAWPANRCINLVCHGHSVPAGYVRTPVVDTLGAYPHQVLSGLKERFPNAVLNVIVTAIGGEHAEAGQARFSQVLGHRPDLVLIDYGTNDRGIGLSRARTAWEAMIRSATSAGAKVLLVTPAHEVYGDGDPAGACEQARIAHAALIRAATAAGAKVLLVTPAHEVYGDGDPGGTREQGRIAHAQLIRTLASEHGVALADADAAFRTYRAQGGDLLDVLSQTNHPNRTGHGLIAREILRWFNVV